MRERERERERAKAIFFELRSESCSFGQSKFKRSIIFYVKIMMSHPVKKFGLNIVESFTLL
jgi:hypothetical protein